MMRFSHVARGGFVPTFAAISERSRWRCRVNSPRFTQISRVCLGKTYQILPQFEPLVQFAVDSQCPSMVVANLERNQAARALRDLTAAHSDVRWEISNFQFEGQGQRETPVAKISVIVEIIMLLQGRTAALIRKQCAELFVRYLGGDLSLVDEVVQLRHVQEVLAAEDPDHFARAFGSAVGPKIINKNKFLS
jgi:hypothetical protein